MELRPALKKLTDKKRLVGAEVGVWRGNYTIEILERLDVKKLYLIDPYAAYETYEDHEKKEIKSAEKQAREQLEQYKQKLVWIHDFSHKAVNWIPENVLDFVYIDGNHNYGPVLADVTAYTQILKEGGLMSGHDFRQTEEGRVVDAVEDYCHLGNTRQLETDHCDWWFWK